MFNSNLIFPLLMFSAYRVWFNAAATGWNELFSTRQRTEYPELWLPLGHIASYVGRSSKHKTAQKIGHPVNQPEERGCVTAVDRSLTPLLCFMHLLITVTWTVVMNETGHKHLLSSFHLCVMFDLEFFVLFLFNFAVCFPLHLCRGHCEQVWTPNDYFDGQINLHQITCKLITH